MTRRRNPSGWLQAARAGARPGVDTWLARALGRAGGVPGGARPGVIEKAIFSGRVELDGDLVRDPFHPVRPGARCRVDGSEVSLEAPTRVLMFHKPAGAAVVPVDRERGCSVYDLLLAAVPEGWRDIDWQAVGRLDRATTGLLLFTNEPAVVAHVTAPEVGLSKTYVAQVDGARDDAALAPLRAGVTIEDGAVDPVPARLLSPGVVELVLREGRHHQVRRMLNAARLPVRALHRSAIGTLLLDVPEGACRSVSPEELRQHLSWTSD